MGEGRKPGGLDLDDFAAPTKRREKKAPNNEPKPRRPSGESAVAASIAAAEAGFTSRKADGSPIDGRSLRRTGRNVQLNIKVSAATKAAFFAYIEANNFGSAGEALEELLAPPEG